MKILIALDRSEYSEIVLEHGLDQTARHPGADLQVITVVENDADVEAARRSIEALVREGLDDFAMSERPFALHVKVGAPAAAITALASELSADLLVIGRFGVPSDSDAIVDTIETPTLVVGIEGHLLEPQCPACRLTRRATDAEQLFCAEHAGDRIPDLVTRLPPSNNISSLIW